jgi:hypothetical protein
MPKETEKKTTETTSESRQPADLPLQAVDVAVGVVPTVAETVRSTAGSWTKAEKRSQEMETLQKRVSTLRDRETRGDEIASLRRRLVEELQKAEAKGGDVRHQVTEQLIGQARWARERVEPAANRVRATF